MRGMDRLWQAAGTVQAVLQPGLVEKAVESGLRSLFIGFETLSPANLEAQRKYQNLKGATGRGPGAPRPTLRDYNAAVKRLHDLGVMVNASFVFGMDDDDETVFDRTVGWAIEQGIETATFHILTPYPGTALYTRMLVQNRIKTFNWDRFDTRHVVFEPLKMTAEALEQGYWRAYQDFYRWGSILQGARTKDTIRGFLRHAAYAGGWKKFEPLWDLVIKLQRVSNFLPFLEGILSGFGSRRGAAGHAQGTGLTRKTDQARSSNAL